MTKTVKNQFMPSDDYNYLIAGNVCNAFAIGNVRSSDDFFLIGTEPEDESNYPLLTGSILDSGGNILCKLVRNILVDNPGNCTRIFGDQVGYEIHDENGNQIFKVQTSFEKLPDHDHEMFVTTLSTDFYDKNGTRVFRANAGEEDEEIETNVKTVFGVSEEFGSVEGMDEKDTSFLRMVFRTGGGIHEPITGLIEGEEITLDGKALMDAHLKNCSVHVKRGEFATYGDNSFDTCQFMFHDTASRVRNLVLSLEKKNE